MTGRESTGPLDPARLAEIAEDHWQANTGQHAGRCDFCGDGWPCGPKLLLDEVDRLTKSLAAERTRVQRVEAECDAEERSEGFADGKPVGYPFPAYVSTRRVRAALAGDTEGSTQPATS